MTHGSVIDSSLLELTQHVIHSTSLRCTNTALIHILLQEQVLSASGCQRRFLASGKGSGKGDEGRNSRNPNEDNARFVSLHPRFSLEARPSIVSPLRVSGARLPCLSAL